MNKILSVFFVILVAGCASHMNNSQDVTPSVVSSFYPIEYIVAQIEPELLQHNLVGQKNIHGFDLSTTDVVMMEKADIVIGLNLELEPWLKASLDKNLVLANTDLTLLEANGFFQQDKHEDEHGDEHEEDEHVDDHDHGDLTFDPHVWMSPKNMMQMAENIYNALTSRNLLSNNAEQRLNQLKINLAELDNKFETELKNCQEKTAFISHDSFAYLEDAYGLELTHILGLSSMDRLSFKDVGELEQVSASAVLVEALENQEYANLLKKDLNLESFVVYNLSKKVDDLDYLQMQNINLESLKSALKCN